MAQMRTDVESVRTSLEPVGDAMTTPPDTASTARRQVHLETLGTIAEQVGEFELAVARIANDPAMDVGEAPELLGRAGNRLGDVREMLRKVRRDVIEA